MTAYRFETVVIGNGLMGSAAGRYLADWGRSVAIIGAGEPPDQTTHTGVFASHYDQGRLCSRAGNDPVWRPINKRAVTNYSSLEAESGVRFHHGVGRVHAVRFDEAARANLLDWIDELRREDGIELDHFGPEDRSWQARFPMLRVPAGYDLYAESAPAGYINPRQLLAAQNTIAQNNGAKIVEELATSVEVGSQGVTITAASGERYEAERALVACGAFSNFNRLLPEPIPLRLKTETTIWATVSPETAADLASMPAVGFDIDSPDIDDIYLAPPIRYPDGTFKLKMGCNTRGESWPTTAAAVQDWFRRGDSDRDLPAMEQALRELLPTAELNDVTSHRCIVTYTPSGYPTIDVAPGRTHGRLFVATGGNGGGAMGSDTLGLLAAGLVEDGRWLDDVPRDQFLATNKWGDSTKEPSKAQQRANAR